MVDSNALNRSPCRLEGVATSVTTTPSGRAFNDNEFDFVVIGLTQIRLACTIHDCLDRKLHVGEFCSSCHLARKSYVRRQDNACCTVASSCADSDQRCDPRDEQPGLGVAGTVRKVGGPRCSCLLYALRIHHRTLSTQVNARTRIRTLWPDARTVCW